MLKYIVFNFSKIFGVLFFMKKLLSIFLSLALSISVLGVCNISFAAQTTDIEPTKLINSSAYYSFDANTKTLTVSGKGRTPNFTNSSGDTTSQPWFYWRSDGSIEHIVVEDGITSLGNYFFYGVSCTDIKLADSIESIGGYAFSGAQIEQIKLPDKLKYINNDAFYFCDNLKEIVFPKSISSIGTSAFENCSVLSKVSFKAMGNELTISSRAFFKCPLLKRVDVPSLAKLSKYSFGYEKASVDGTYDGFTLGVFSGSKAYNYAKSSFINYELLNEIAIEEGDVASRTYTEDNLSEQTVYKFTPNSSSQYTFKSSGEVDVNCVLKDNDGNTLASADDNDESDLNFTLKYDFEAGKTYYFYVNSVNSLGTYSVSLSSETIVNISISWDITYQASDLVGKNFSPLEYIKTQTVDFEYASGYVYKMPFNNGASYRGMELKYNNLLNGNVTCGENKDSITVGNKTLEFTINVVHSYVNTVVNPTITGSGYTEHKCVYCGDTYRDSYVDNLGQDVYGNVYLINSKNGGVDLNRPLEDVDIYNNDGKYVGSTDKNGAFCVEYAYDYIVLKYAGAVERKIKITNNTPNLGNIGLIYGDLTEDGYINAKDYAYFVHLKNYDINSRDDIYLKNLDSDKDGVLTDDDWAFAKEFYTFDKLSTDTYSSFLQ